MLGKWATTELLELSKGKCESLPLRRNSLRPQYRSGAKFLESSSAERELGVLLDVLVLNKAKGILGCLSRCMSSRSGGVIGECLWDCIWSSASTLDSLERIKSSSLGRVQRRPTKMARAWNPWCKRGGWGSLAFSALRWDDLESRGWWVVCRLIAVCKYWVGVKKSESDTYQRCTMKGWEAMDMSYNQRNVDSISE